ncbi:MAG: ABC transporter ATP-binding protein [Thermomicrobiales bacterium]
MSEFNGAVLGLDDISVWVADGAFILRDVSLRVHLGEHWALLGPNGSGKSTLLSVAGAVRHPSKGRASVLGGELGRVSVWDLRAQIGVVDPALKLIKWLTVEDVVLTGATGTIQPLWDRYGAAERERAHGLLELLGCASLADREIATCSQGERQRVRIARALMPDPPLLLLDEPATGLDLPSREALIAALAALATANPTLATVLVSHHLEELPPTTTHALLLREGVAIVQGPAHETITSEHVSACFGFDIRVHYEDGRWAARAAASWRTRATD